MSIRLLRSLALAALLAGCGGGSFTTSVKGSGTVPGNPNPLGQVLDQFPGFGSFANIDFASSQDFKNQGVTKDHVTSVTAKKVTVRITTPNDQDFAFLDTLAFSAKTAGQPDVVVAQKSDISALGLAAPNPTLDMDTTGAELQPYVTADSMSIGVSGSGRPPPHDTTLEAVVTLEVHFKLF